MLTVIHVKATPPTIARSGSFLALKIGYTHGIPSHDVVIE